jgi:hypothetical protein
LISLSAKAKISADEANFLSYLAEQGKSYTSRAEFETRLQNWVSTDQFIKNYPQSTFTLGHNHFSDYSDAERERIFGGKLKTPQTKSTQKDQKVSTKQRLGARCADGLVLDPLTKNCVSSTGLTGGSDSDNKVLKSCAAG